MGNTAPKTLSKQELSMLQSSTVFTKQQLDELFHHFRDIAKGEEGIKLSTLKEGLAKHKITFDAKFIESLFYAFDTEGRGMINLQQFCSGLSIITKSNNDEDKLQLLFSLYDQEGRDAVSREDLVNAFHSMRRAMGGIRLDKDKGEPESAEDIKGIIKYVNEVFEKIIEIRKDSPEDAIHRGYMSFADFKVCVKYHPLVIEVGSVFLSNTCQPLFNTPEVSSTTLEKKRSSSFRRTYKR
eukprot:TRINITY_DN12387_c0_g1_i1.p2 TRINITY_DN12387_c0_g1~~TRINITY_DN12387_c0_g1_i1.p2  ORF type:complete len:239 (+),score=98.34 TRINITY_DN12387_c0_g1_i1:147-863(+)